MLFRVGACLFALVIGGFLYALYPAFWSPEARRIRLNREAWECSFTERGLSVPKKGPRNGYWDARISSKNRHRNLSWTEQPQSLPGLLEIDQFGHQHFRSRADQKHKVLIFGGSVAMGTYSSTIERSYFHLLGVELERMSSPADITVVSACAWKSRQEVTALELFGSSMHPDLIVFLNGLNDLTVGATADSLFGEPVKTRDGSPWTPSYHVHDYQRRTALYLRNMRRAADWAGRNNVELLLVLQPALPEHHNLSELEKSLLKDWLKPHESLEALTDGFERQRRGLQDLKKMPHVHFLDCSRAFDVEKKTTFTDMYHFSDPGHELLGRQMAPAIAAILRSLPTQQVNRSSAANSL
jgi:lysophospholipase L1-like esterase